MSAVYAFGSNLHDAFDLGDDILQVDRPTKLKHHTLLHASWSQAIFRTSSQLAHTGLPLPNSAPELTPALNLFGHNEWVASHSPHMGRITRLSDGRISDSQFDAVAMNGVGEVLTAEYSSPPTLILFPNLDAALAHPSSASPPPLRLPFPLRLPSATHTSPYPRPPLTLHPGLSHFLLHAPPHHLLALGDNRFSQSSTHAPPLPCLPPTPVPELEGMEPIACVAGGRHSAAVSAGGEVWVWGSGRGEKGMIDFEGEEEVEVRGVSCGQDHTVVWTDRGVWAAGANEFGQLGAGDTKARERFVRVVGLDGCGEVERVVCTRWATYVQVREP